MSLLRKKVSRYPGITAEQKNLADLILWAAANGIITNQDAQRALVRYLNLHIAG
jgi:hypothetical protein